jgi:PAS domain S-box-containing protein
MIDMQRQEVSLHKLITDAIPIGIFLCDPAGRVTGWTGSAEKVVGVGEADAIGRSFQDFFRPADEDERSRRKDQLIGRASNYREVGFAIRADGSPMLAVFTMDRVTDERGIVTGYACTLGPV